MVRGARLGSYPQSAGSEAAHCDWMSQGECCGVGAGAKWPVSVELSEGDCGCVGAGASGLCVLTCLKGTVAVSELEQVVCECLLV